jgi:hypothetical protein
LPSIVRVTRPSRPDKARRLGYKAKQVSRGNGCESSCSSHMRRGIHLYRNELGDFSFVQDPAASNKGHLVMVTFGQMRELGRGVWGRERFARGRVAQQECKSTSNLGFKCIYHVIKKPGVWSKLWGVEVCGWFCPFSERSPRTLRGEAQKMAAKTPVIAMSS